MCLRNSIRCESTPECTPLTIHSTNSKLNRTLVVANLFIITLVYENTDFIQVRIIEREAVVCLLIGMFNALLKSSCSHSHTFQRDSACIDVCDIMFTAGCAAVHTKWVYQRFTDAYHIYKCLITLWMRYFPLSNLNSVQAFLALCTTVHNDWFRLAESKWSINNIYLDTVPIQCHRMRKRMDNIQL